MYGSVKVWQEIISLPTWTTGAEDPNPCFWKNAFIKDLPAASIPTA
jgi:hypothetical protein